MLQFFCMKGILHKIFSKVGFAIIILIVIFLGFFYWLIIEKQFLKIKGAYYIYKGDQAYSRDNMSKTLEYYNKGLSLYPEHYEAWFNLGNIYAVYEDYFSAVNAYEQAIKHNPNFVLAKMNLGIVYSEELGLFDSALEQFDAIPNIKILKLWIPFVYSNIKSVKANKGIAYYNSGLTYKRKAMYLPIEKSYLINTYLQQAVDAYQKALKYLNNNYDIYYNKALTHHLMGNSREAGLDYCKAIKIAPMRFEAHYNLAILLRATHHYRESVNELEKAALLILEQPDSSSLQTTYIFNLLNEVSRRLINSNEYYVTKITDEPTNSSMYTYVNGKIVPDEEFDKAMLENFKNCAGINYFAENEDWEE